MQTLRKPMIQNIRDTKIANQRVFIRVDFNVPLGEPDAEGRRPVEDDSRIVEALPTIRFAIEKGAKVILASHLGRPKDGKPDPAFSLEPAASHLAKLLGTEVTLADDCVGEGIELMVKNMKNGQVLVLENLRFHAEEEANDPKFCHQLLRITDVYINDAFGTAHRKHASTYGLPSIAPIKAMGFLIEKELAFLDPLLENPQKPFYAILGGSKVSDKIKTIEALMRNVNGLLIGGAMAHAFAAARGEQLPEGAKKPAPEDVEAAKSVMKEAKKREMKLELPIDTLQGFDIGPKTIAAFKRALENAKTVFWNGPLGWFEKPEYAHGTFEIAKALAEGSSIKVVGGGDTVSAIKQSGYADRFQHLSTGGGAVLEYLEGAGLPGIDILKVLPNSIAARSNRPDIA